MPTRPDDTFHPNLNRHRQHGKNIESELISSLELSYLVLLERVRRIDGNLDVCSMFLDKLYYTIIVSYNNKMCCVEVKC